MPGILVMDNGTSSVLSIITFHEGMSNGIDPSYDAGQFSGNPDFSIFTKLVENDEGVEFRIQALPELAYYDVTIPIGIDLKENTEVTFTAEGICLPEGYTIFLEDKVQQVFVELSMEEKGYTLLEDYSIHSDERLFVHVLAPESTSDLANDFSTEKISAYYAGGRIRIRGIEQNSWARLYDLNGRELGTYELHVQELNDIPAEQFESGIYLLQVANGRGKHSLKVPKF